MHVLQRLFFGNYILSVALLSWLAAQICKTIINYILSGKFEAERMWGAGGMPSAHSALVCSMFMAAAKSQGVKQLVAGGGGALIGVTLIPLLSGLLG